MNTRDMADFWRVHPETIRRMYRRGDLPTIKQPNGRLHFDPTEVMNACEVTGPQPETHQKMRDELADAMDRYYA